jgi:hypothetical protein
MQGDVGSDRDVSGYEKEKLKISFDKDRLENFPNSFSTSVLPREVGTEKVISEIGNECEKCFFDKS